MITFIALISAAQIELCTAIGDAAENVMTTRQNGVPLSQVLEAATQPDMPSFAPVMVLKAYEKPLYNTEQYRLQAISDYREVWEMACYKQQT